MRVRSYQVVALTLASAAFPLACAGILGDFTVGATGGSDGGSSSGSSSGTGSSSGASSSSGSSSSGGSSSGGSSGSSGSSGGESDGGDAAAPALLNCQIQGGTIPQKIATLPLSSSSYDPQLFNASVGNQTTFRAYVREQGTNGPSINHVYTFGQGGGGGASDIPIPQANNVMALVRYPTGIGALLEANLAGSTVNVLQVTTLDNTANAWTTPVTVTGSGDFTACANDNNVQGGLVVNSATPASYTVVWSCQGTTTNVLRAVQYSGGVPTSYTWPAPPVPDGGTPNSFSIGGMAQVGQLLYVMVNPPSNNGPPPPGTSPSMFVATTTSATQFSNPAIYHVPLAAQTDFMLGITLAATNGSQLGVSALEANLGSTTASPTIYAGSVPLTKIPTLTPSTDLGTAAVASLSELPVVNNGNAHWESFSAAPASDNLLAVGSVYPNSNGLNFMWINGAGSLVAERVGSNSLFYFDTSDGGSGATIYGGDLTFNGAPLAALAGLEILYLQPGPEADGGAGVVVWANQLACVP